MMQQKHRISLTISFFFFLTCPHLHYGRKNNVNMFDTDIHDERILGDLICCSV